MEILGLSGSARSGSLNTALLRAAARRAPEGATLSVRTIAGIPVYDGDVEEREGIPEAVRELKDAIAGADGLLVATPEYNGSLPGPLKNAIDWCSRPPADIGRVFAGRPVALVGVTPGRLGTALAQAAWLPVFRALRMRVFTGGQLLVPGADGVFGDGGGLADEKLAARLASFLSDFASFCRAG